MSYLTSGGWWFKQKETLRKRNREMGEKRDGELYGNMKEAVSEKQCCRVARDLIRWVPMGF